MKKEILKNNRGITLVALATYMIVILIVLGILSTISSFFYDNLNIVRDSAKYASEFDKFNSFILSDVKNNNKVYVDQNSNTIIFEDGTTYVYNDSDEGVYRGNAKIATHVTFFSASKKTITINNVEKDILTIHIIIGDSTKTLMNKQIDYTLKYW